VRQRPRSCFNKHPHGAFDETVGISDAGIGELGAVQGLQWIALSGCERRSKSAAGGNLFEEYGRVVGIPRGEHAQFFGDFGVVFLGVAEVRG
jgi:hypothetical protein